MVVVLNTIVVVSDTLVIVSNTIVVVSNTLGVMSNTIVVVSDTVIVVSNMMVVMSNTILVVLNTLVVVSSMIAIVSNTTTIVSSTAVFVSDTIVDDGCRIRHDGRRACSTTLESMDCAASNTMLNEDFPPPHLPMCSQDVRSGHDHVDNAPESPACKRSRNIACADTTCESAYPVLRCPVQTCDAESAQGQEGKASSTDNDASDVDRVVWVPRSSLRDFEYTGLLFGEGDEGGSDSSASVSSSADSSPDKTDLPQTYADRNSDHCCRNDDENCDVISDFDYIFSKRLSSEKRPYTFRLRMPPSKKIVQSVHRKLTQKTLASVRGQVCCKRECCAQMTLDDIKVVQSAYYSKNQQSRDACSTGLRRTSAAYATMYEKLSSFVRDNGDSMPNDMKTKEGESRVVLRLPACYNKVDIYKLLKSKFDNISAPCVSLQVFYNMWRTQFWHVKFHDIDQNFAKCEKCVEYKESINSAKFVRVREYFVSLREKHLNLQLQHRAAYEV
ncbi:hypothetical protein CBR_g20304 [Chara braunii]|uniref:Uncharacterized protein n=1 Tax=Chara braunii TaxID=69332 RepID=A0A388L042_CHABU|nr:hypothetical protein CBR_g20304 [Chara braunii]|eukprot:GBG75677.1 hypothetical protein CBR_g20304 [Chara braunii]